MAAVAQSPPLLGRQAPVASRPRRVSAAGHAGVRLAAFAALALLVCERYASLDLTPPRGRVLVAVLIATVTAAALIAAAGLHRGRPAGEPALATGVVCGLVLLAGLWAGMRAVGVPGHLLWPGHWGTLHTRVGDGLNGLSGWLWPYRGGERWARVDVLMVIPLVLTAAAAL